MTGEIWQLEQRMADRRRRDRILLAIAAVVIAGLAAGLAIALRGGGHTAAQPPPGNGTRPVGTSSTPPASPPASPSASISPGSSADMTTMTFEGAMLPVSRTSGPYHVDRSLPYGNLVSGFAETPLGAALAAVHLSVRVSPNAGPKVFIPTIGDHVIGDSRRFLEQVTQQYQTEKAQSGTANGGPISAGTAADIVGYRVDGYSTTNPVTIHVLSSQPGSAVYVDIPVTLQWASADWKLIPPPTGSFTGTRVPSTSGYQAF